MRPSGAINIFTGKGTSPCTEYMPQYWNSPSAAQELETRWAELNDASQDCQEGKAAFREKRTPVFKGL
jgi:hypothetical protein